jgi:hypothetical protein
MDIKSLLPDTNDTKDVVIALAAAGAAYLLAQKALKVKSLYKQKPWYYSAGAAVGGLVVGHLGYVEYQKHEAAQKVAGYLG